MARRVEPKGARLLPVAPRGRCGSIRTLTRLRQSPRLGLQLPHLGPTWQSWVKGLSLYQLHGIFILSPSFGVLICQSLNYSHPSQYSQ